MNFGLSKLFILTLTTPIGSCNITQLSRYEIDENSITLSGFSSGGGFAQQLQISHSSLFLGIAVFQHGFYRCGPGDGDPRAYDDACTIIFNSTREMFYNPEKSSEEIERYFKEGLIDDPINLRNKRLYVYAGLKNWVHTPDLSLKILNVYEPLIRNPDAIRTRAQTANLTLPTNRFGGPCAEDSSGNYFLSNCGLSAPFEALNFLLTNDSVKYAPPAHKDITLEPLRLFDQAEFTDGIQGEHLMDTLGFLYIPSRCHRKRCLLHLYFHGCKTGREFVGENHIRNSGFLEIAELNDIIMVFPQAVSNVKPNRWGCWDTYGITGRLYATKRGVQVTAVRNMLSRIVGTTNS